MYRDESWAHTASEEVEEDNAILSGVEVVA